MTPEKMDDWLSVAMNEVGYKTASEKGKAWRAALHGIALEIDPDARAPNLGFTKKYCGELVKAGADPEQIRAMFVLIFY